MDKKPSNTSHTNMFGLSDEEMDQLNRDTIAIIKRNQAEDQRILANEKKIKETKSIH